MANDSFTWGPCTFDLEKARQLALKTPNHWIKPGKRYITLEEPFDHITPEHLHTPVIFASFLNVKLGKVGVLMIDGAAHMGYAVKHRMPVCSVVLNTLESVELCAGHSQINPLQWRRLIANAKYLGLEGV